MDAFTRATQVHRTDDDRFTAQVSADFAVPGGAPNGGYLTALAARALTTRLDAPDPLTVTTHYLAPPNASDVELLTEVLKPKGRHRTGTVRVLQEGVEVVRVTGTFTDLTRAEGATVVDGGPPTLPPADELLRTDAHDLLPPVFHQTTLRLTRESIGWAFGEPRGEALLEGLTGLPGVDAVPTLGLLFLADAVPPPIFSLAEVDFGWMPTLELTTQVRKRPAPGDLACRFRTRFLTRGYLELDAELWDAEGDLVGLARQTALQPRSA